MRFHHLRKRAGRRSSLTLIFAAATLLALVLVVAACGGSSTTTTAAPGTTAGPATTGGGATTTAGAAGGAQVSIKGFAFSPADVTIKVGETVTWTNEDSATHTIAADNGGFTNSGDIAQGATYSTTFDKAGTFPYHCSIHPNMKGTVTVQ
jgi:plastocyanin